MPARSAQTTPAKTQPSRTRAVLLAVVVTQLLTSSASAQVHRPADAGPRVPLLPSAADASDQILPAIPLPKALDKQGVLQGLRFEINSIRVRGNTIVSDADIARVFEPFKGRVVTYADLQKLRDALTMEYVRRGYVTSGAVIPDQSIKNGTVEFAVVEGSVSNIKIETDGRFRESYLKKRVARYTGAPVNITELEKALRLLQRDRRIERIDAQLTPGDVRGESILTLKVSERAPYELGAEFNNYQSVAIGAEGGLVDASYTNVSGWGDSVSAGYHGTEGLNKVNARYEVPVTAQDLTLGAHYFGTWSKVVEEPFEILEVKNRSYTVGFSIAQPVYRTLQNDVEISISAEYRYNKSFLFGSGFSFTGPIEAEGESKVAVLRLEQQWVYRGKAQAFAARSAFSFGLDALGATKYGGADPDGQFFSWLAQFQWARLLTNDGIQLIAHADLQLSADPLLGLEQFGIGGHSTVRGYRENENVRDQGVVGSAEVRIPAWRNGSGESVVELAPFLDVGHSWNRKRRGSGFGSGDNSESLLGMGLGLRWAITDWSAAQIYWGENLLDRDSPGKWNLQDTSLYLRLRADLP